MSRVFEPGLPRIFNFLRPTDEAVQKVIERYSVRYMPSGSEDQIFDRASKQEARQQNLKTTKVQETMNSTDAAKAFHTGFYALGIACLLVAILGRIKRQTLAMAKVH